MHNFCSLLVDRDAFEDIAIEEVNQEATGSSGTNATRAEAERQQVASKSNYSHVAINASRKSAVSFSVGPPLAINLPIQS